MLRSLWAGVSGLQSHQIALDIEGNNIANVNTIGFKYSRASFSDLLSQTQKIATAPQGNLGGKNPQQVGLGTQVNAITKIFKQGSVQTTDKNTDLALQGDGFFIVSPDGGKTYKFSRNGDFTFDAGGNFVDNNGYIIQGWTRDGTTGEIDATAPIANIQVAPGLTTPAQKSSFIDLKANLNSGLQIDNQSPIYSLDENHLAYDFDTDNNVLDGGNINGTDGNDDDADGLVDEDYVNENSPVSLKLDSDGKVIERAENMAVLFNETGEAFNLQLGQGMYTSFKAAQSITTDIVNGSNIVANSLTINNVTIPSSDITTGDPEDNAKALVNAINTVKNTTNVSAELVQTGGNFKIRLINDNSNKIKNIDISVVGAVPNHPTGFRGSEDSNTMKKFIYTDGAVRQIGWENADQSDSDTFYFRSTEDLRQGLQELARDPDASGTDDNAAQVKINNLGQFQITLPDNGDTTANSVTITIDEYSDATANVSENLNFTRAFNSLQGFLPEGDSSLKISQGMYAATHASSVDIFDSLGTKHTVRLEFRKTGYTQEGGTQWDFTVQVPKPSEINSIAPTNFVEGSITFNDNGSLSSFTPASLNFTANNGSAPNQTITLDFGISNQFNGLTSFDSTSNTSGIAQDGFPGGDLAGIRIDETGTLVGSFTNGRSFGLAKVAVAKFTNNEGLETDGGNVYRQTSNSGDPIIGQAATGGRGFVQASALELSNVDLSRSLTQLIVIQRGYQANSKTITTSDQILNTLLQLKQ